MKPRVRTLKTHPLSKPSIEKKVNNAVIKVMLTDKERIKRIKAHFEAEMEKNANKHKDTKLLLESYKILTTQKWPKQFLSGYLAGISDLLLIKKMR